MTGQAHRILSRSQSATEDAGQAFARSLRPGDVVALSGDLGSGKTTFVRGLVAGLGGESGDVASPTFAIVNTYQTAVAQVHHIDVYRVGGESELDELGFDEYMDGAAIVVIEWPERVLARLPSAVHRVSLTHGQSGTREIILSQRND